MKRILILNGPNLNLLGSREPEVYGSITLPQIEDRLRVWADKAGVELRLMQSNHEGELVDAIQSAKADCDGIVLNPGAFGHTSYAMRDAISATAVPTVEVHISNIHAREEFRQVCVLTAVCRGQITGLGWRGYLLALKYLLEEDGL